MRLKWHSAYSTPFRDKTLSVQSLKFVQVPVPFVYLSPFRSLFESARVRDGRVQYSQLSMQDVSSYSYSMYTFRAGLNEYQHRLRPAYLTRTASGFEFVSAIRVLFIAYPHPKGCGCCGVQAMRLGPQRRARIFGHIVVGTARRDILVRARQGAVWRTACILRSYTFPEGCTGQSCRGSMHHLVKSSPD